MQNYKSIVVTLIIITSIIQCGNLLLNRSAYNKLYKTISGIFLIFILLTAVKNTAINIYTTDIPDINKANEYNSNMLEDNFKSNLRELIIDDLHNLGYVNNDISIETTLDKLKIYIISDINNQSTKEIKNYIEDKYCTPKDEVIIANERD